MDSGAVSTWQGWTSAGEATRPLYAPTADGSCSSGRGTLLPRGNMVWLLDSVSPVVLPSLEAHSRELTQIFWVRKGAQMHLC